MRTLVIALGCSLFATLVAGEAHAAGGIGAYLEPTAGYTWINLKSLEIETTFVRPPLDDDGEPVDDQADFDLDDARRSVGRRTHYTGGGGTIGISGGVRLFDLWLGINYSYIPAEMDGFSKRYRYEPEKVRATGKKFEDSGTAWFQRLTAEFKYGLPIWRFAIDFRTRVGAIYVNSGPLIMGRAVESGSGYTGDLGGGLSFTPFSYVAVGVTGWFGFFSFTGKYDGAYGTVGGIDVNIIFHI
jgi:hypothetical protein